MIKEAEIPQIKKPLSKPLFVIVILILSDLIGAYLAFYLATITRRLLIPWLGGSVSWKFNIPIMYLGMGFVFLLFTFLDLYPGYGLTALKEIERVVQSLTIVYVFFGVTVYFLKVNTDFPRSVFLLSWLLSILFIPFFRIIIRNRLSLFRWYGKPVLFVLDSIDNPTPFESVIRSRRLGLRPIALYVINGDYSDKTFLDIPAVPSLNKMISIKDQFLIESVLCAFDPFTGVEDKHLQITRNLSAHFKSITLISSVFEFGSIWINARDLEGFLGLELQYNLLYPQKIFLKRVVDIIGSIVLLLITFPIWAIVIAAIKLDSKGPIFYSHKRVGKDNKKLGMLKFRTMVEDADKQLLEYLNAHPEAKQEWEDHQKLKEDPRITRVGKWLRKFSIDEIPQFWNVLKGEMSLIGPRAVTEEEVLKYGDFSTLILRVKPGITGWWQVMGRNETTWEQRLRFEVYYVSNWSLLMDFYITIKTIWVIISGQGR